MKGKNGMKNLNKNIKLSLVLLLFTMLALTPAANAAQISTDQEDYGPDEIVYITGTGFNINSVITVTIVGPEEWGTDQFDSLSFPWWVYWSFTEPDRFDIGYLKVKCLGEFTVTATDGTNTATTTFTDGNTYVNGTVKDSSDNPISSATVSCTTPNGTFTDTTDASGNYSIHVTFPGGSTYSITVTASKTGYTSNSISFTATNNTTYNGKDIILAEEEVIDIEVTADSGQTKIVGDPDPASFTYGVTGSLESGDSFIGALTRDSGETVGAYPIRQGTLDIDNSGSGKTYNLTFVSADFTITDAPTPIDIEVTANSGQTKTFGDLDPTSFTYHISSGALEAGDDFTGALTRVSGEAVGPYAILQGTLGIDNSVSGKTYNLTFVSANFTITALDIVITPDSGQHKVYGETDPTLTYTYNPALIGSDVITGALDRVAGEDVGTYNITLGTLTAGSNYNLILYVPLVTFEITPLEITVTPDSGQGKVYGDPDPTLTYDWSPELIDDDDFSGELGRDPGEDVGIYEITQGTLALSSNYTLTFTDGIQFEITPLEITVTPDSDQSKFFGNADPTLTYTYSPELIDDDDFSGELGRDPGEDVGFYDITQGTLALSSNYILTFISGIQFEIKPAVTSLVLTVNPQILVAGTSINLSATLSCPDSPSVVGGKTIAFTLDIDPFTGVPGTYSLGTAITNGSGVANLTIPTAGWLGDVYEITATYAGDDNIVGSEDFATITVLDPGAAATGGGFIADNGRTNFGFTVKMVEGTTNTYKGRFVIVNNGKWRMKGTLDTYGTLDGTGYASGSGTLYQWTYDGVLEIWYWDEVASDVDIMLTFTDTYNGSGTGNTKKTVVLDTFGIQIDYSSVDFDASNPNTDPLSLKGGNIDIKSANNTTDGDPATPPPTGKGKNK